MNAPAYYDPFPPGSDHRIFERLAFEIDKHFGGLLERTRDAIQITLDFGKDDGCILIFMPDWLDVRLPAAEWVGHLPVASSYSWKRIEIEDMTVDDVCELIDNARDALRASMVECCHCRKQFLPEHTITIEGQQCCHGCASKHHGVVF